MFSDSSIENVYFLKQNTFFLTHRLSDLDESEEIYSAMLHSHMNIIEKLITISDERLDFLRKNYESEKRKILQRYEKDINDYKSKKFQLQKALESVYYGLAERSLKTTKLSEEDFLQRQDELRNSVSVNFYYCIVSYQFTMLRIILLVI